MKSLPYLSKRITFFVLFLIIGLSQELSAANIVFDLNGVLVESSRAIRHIGFTRFIGFFNPIHIEDFILDLLDSLIPRRKDTPNLVHEGRLVSQILCDYQCGILSADEARNLALKRLNALASGIESKRKVKLIRAIIDLIFTPSKFSKTITPIKSGTEILKKCYKQRDQQGNRKHKIFILSNWDPESFPLLFENKKLKKIFDMVDGYLISGDAGMLKPGKNFYEYAFHYFSINPDTELTIYIDDELCNIRGAHALNKKKLKYILCDDFSLVDKTLQRLGIY